jgi:hypothetical protein
MDDLRKKLTCLQASRNTFTKGVTLGLLLKINNIKLFLLPVLITGLGLMPAAHSAAQTFTVLHNFAALDSHTSTNNDGANPDAGLILSGNTLYGTSFFGGTNGNGSLFSISYPPPQLTIMSSGSNVNITWPSEVAGFSYSGYTLQSSTNLVSSTIWSSVSAIPIVGSTNIMVTNSISDPQMFYRLSL